MNGYLMQERSFVQGGDTFVESFSPNHPYGVVFEDDGVTGYFYAVEKDAEGQGLRVLDALHIYEVPAAPDPAPASAGSTDPLPSKLMIVWSKDWKKCALVIDGYCHAIFDFEAQGGYNINEFPPPNSFWTQGDRKLTDELMKKLF
ncbi:MAG: DUF2251 domain-containing protein [Bacteroidota bacterium]|nr:DUF2251 domain-containing protein [Bacteroidota bacterium]MDP4216647.1 DUF2251 domain-containing protein [Bacteroidota bacterium]MDP4245320.1 DUF2251 domain-containing protein [Bacteroidota bacterium]MDP4253373.1 DUF2251 domain-containing protein [Bacteroidota bacterium]MDP4260832.1 DUF2251 domain-containing protein [Bacteroidota bacterium]